ncbi:MAG: YqaJ viral recombinase family protein [Lachnospiraceae bacterium]|nr:YqaJ viral recombinase family protein [Lachnospiraceae bacterium]
MRQNTISTRDLSREQWLELRRRGIGGSDASVVMRQNPYRSVIQLWEEKTGRLLVEDTGNEYTYWGNVMEPIIRREFTKRTGLKVRQKHAMILHPKHPFLFADLDGIVTDGDGRKCIFEAKTVSQYREEQWKDGIPEEYMLQVQHYMEVCGMDKTYIAGLIGGNRFVFHKVYRDEQIIRELLEAEVSFWNENVIADRRPAVDGTDATTDYLNGKYKRAVPDCIALPQPMKAVLERYDEVNASLNELETQKKELANQLKEALQEHEAGEIDGRLVSWKKVQKMTFDSGRFRKEEPELFRQYQKDSSYRRLSVALPAA